MIENLKERLFAKWIACRLISDKKSVQYGLYFSYPLYLLIVISGILLKNPYILTITALIAFLSIKLPIHPFDYIYNYTIAKLFGTNKIPGRGSELQVNSVVALIFNLVVFCLVTFGVSINYVLLAVIFSLSSIFFIVIFLFKD